MTSMEEDDEAEVFPPKSVQSLVDLVFSWSIHDVLNKDLYKDKVQLIPTTFPTSATYLKSFILPLIEETHADLCSSMEDLADKSTYKISSLERSKEYDPPKDLLYDIEIERTTSTKNAGNKRELETGDLFALTDIRPRCVEDLSRPKSGYLIALVRQVKEEEDCLKLQILTSTPVVLDQDMYLDERIKTFFGVSLVNMTTNMRIWRALNSELGSSNLSIIDKVLKPDSFVRGDCRICSFEKYAKARTYSHDVLHSSGLNKSQEEAVLKCLATRGCVHDNTVKLIWGPPGTGKTKTIGALLCVLQQMKCRTLTCAPTNLAVVEVTKRLVRLVMDSGRNGFYGLGDVVLFGNRERMQIDADDELSYVFLDNRTQILGKCFAPMSGWRHHLRRMISLLDDPGQQYHLYLNDKRERNSESDDDMADEEMLEFGGDRKEPYSRNFGVKNRKLWMKIIAQTLRDNKERKKGNEVLVRKNHSSDGKTNNGNYRIGNKRRLNFGEFLKKEFKYILKEMKYFVVNLCIHLPTCFISLEVVENMFQTLDFLDHHGTLLCSASIVSDEEILNITEDGRAYFSGSSELSVSKRNCLQMLRSLPEAFFPPDALKSSIRAFCLDNACLLFCTASSSVRLHTRGRTPVELLVVDEAAQLKECESAIPLQLPGLRHAMLIGDEQQLPAMVQSKMCEEAEFGRSLFERLVSLGHRKHLLNVQYRMHPSISLFPNRRFYKRQILDAQNVKERGYHRSFLQGDLYGSYSFIDIALGKEDVNDGHSLRNMVEVAAVCDIISRLFKESIGLKKRIGIGVISPYKSQVSVIQEKLGTTYSSDPKSDFSVRVRTVDGFQGGEEDVIIISTVRSNGNGAVGFLSNNRRVNVALTRARYCLWILGNGKTLKKRGSVWKEIVDDAGKRGSFHHADKDRNLSVAIIAALVDVDQLDIRIYVEPLLFSGARWKVDIDDLFWESMERVKDIEIRKEALFLLIKLSWGWRPPHEEANLISRTGMSTRFLEYYKVNELLNIVWTVTIHEEKYDYKQVLTFWDISALSYSGIAKVAKKLNDILGTYSLEVMSLCKYKHLEGDLTVPLEVRKEDYMQLLSIRFAGLSLQDDL